MLEFLTANSCGAGASDAAFPLNPYMNAAPDVCATIFWVSVIGGIVGVITIFAAIKVLNQILNGKSGTAAAKTLALFAAIWAIGAPFWFWAEYWFLYMASPPAEGADGFAQFRHNQQLAAAIWAGVLAFAIVVLTQAFRTLPERAAQKAVAELKEPPRCFYVVSYNRDDDPATSGHEEWRGMSESEAMKVFLQLQRTAEVGRVIKIIEENYVKNRNVLGVQKTTEKQELRDDDQPGNSSNMA